MSAWVPWINSEDKCPKCGGNNLQYDSLCVLTSYPAQYKLRCLNCGEHFFSGSFHSDIYKTVTVNSNGDIYEAEFPEISGTFMTGTTIENCDIPFEGWNNRGWICSKCGASLSPSTSYCPFCSPKRGCTYGTSTKDGVSNFYQTTSLNIKED